MQKPLRFGMLGAAKIGPKALIDPARVVADAEVVAVAARDAARARAYADTHGITHALSSYEALVSHPDVDVVYVALPMSAHEHWSVASLRAGKAVLCEKPFAANADEARRMLDAAAAEGGLLVEAFHYRYHPLFQRVLEIVRSGLLGRLKHLDSLFTVAIKDRDDLRHRYETAGGATMDLGCYPVHWMRAVAQAALGPEVEPQVVNAKASQGAKYVDVRMEVNLAFPDGLTAHFLTSMEDHYGYETLLRVEGDHGTLLVENPLAPHGGHRLELTVDGVTTNERHDSGRTTYDHQLAAFCDAYRSGQALPTGGADALHNMLTIDAIYRAAGLPIRGDKTALASL